MVLRGVNEKVPGHVDRSAVVQLEHLLSEPQRPRARPAQHLVGCGPARVVEAGEVGGRLRVRDDPRAGGIDVGRADVVAVRMAVDHVRDRLAGHLTDRLQQMRCQRRRRVDHDDAVAGLQEDRVVQPLGHPIEAAADLLNQVAVGRDGRAAGVVGHWGGRRARNRRANGTGLHRSDQARSSRDSRQLQETAARETGRDDGFGHPGHLITGRSRLGRPQGRAPPVLSSAIVAPCTPADQGLARITIRPPLRAEGERAVTSPAVRCGPLPLARRRPGCAPPHAQRCSRRCAPDDRSGLAGPAGATGPRPARGPRPRTRWRPRRCSARCRAANSPGAAHHSPQASSSLSVCSRRAARLSGSARSAKCPPTSASGIPMTWRARQE